MTFFTRTGRHRVQIIYFFGMQIGSRTPSGIGLGSGSRLRRMRPNLELPRELWIEIFGKSWPLIPPQRTMGDVSYTGSGGVRGVGDCTCPVRTPSDLRETSWSRIDRIPSTRPPWWRRQYRELKKLFFSAPRKCPIYLFGLLANRKILKRLQVSVGFCLLVSYEAASSTDHQAKTRRSGAKGYAAALTRAQSSSALYI